MLGIKRKQMEYAFVSDKGDRDINEDSIGVWHNGHRFCFALCDGLGGHGQGNVASAIAVKATEDVFMAEKNSRSVLPKAFQTAQDRIMVEQEKKNAWKQMKSTAVCLTTDSHTAYIGHVGDSRLYAFGKDKILFRTKDHSIVQMMAEIGDIEESEIRTHKDRSTLLRVLGVEWEKPQYEIMKPVPLKKCHAFLLCSDGFWEFIDEAEMCEIYRRSQNAQEWLDEMTAVVRANGKNKDMDNYSAIAVWVT